MSSSLSLVRPVSLQISRTLVPRLQWIFTEVSQASQDLSSGRKVFKTISWDEIFLSQEMDLSSFLWSLSFSVFSWHRGRMHSCEVETSLHGGLQICLGDEKAGLVAADQLLAIGSSPLQVGEGGEGGIDGFEPLSLQDRKPPKHRMYHHQFSLSTHAACVCVWYRERVCKHRRA